MKYTIIFFVFWVVLLNSTTIFGQDAISIVYQGRQELSKAGQDIMNAQGFLLPKVVSAYTLTIRGGSSDYTLDSLVFQNTHENFKKYLIWDRIHKVYNENKYSYQKGVFIDGRCYESNINYVRELDIDKTQKKRILGLDCYFAEYDVDGHHYEVWYTEDLPYTDGPFILNEFNNVNLPLLPGVVLEIQESPNGSFFKATDIIVGENCNLPNYSVDCKDILPIKKYDRSSYRNLLENHAVKLTGNDIVVGKWYPSVK